MADLETSFAAASEAVKHLPERPGNADLLQLYALYKQGSSGDVSGKRPGAMAFVERAKYDAWAEFAGVGQDEAKQRYIDLVERLKTG